MELISSLADILTILLGIVSAISSVFAWINAYKIKKKLDQKEKRQNQKIKVILENIQNDQILQLPVQLRRAEFTRAEILGRIGMIPIKTALIQKGQKRFRIKYLNNPEFLQQIDEIQEDGKQTELRIRCDQDELNQFDM